MITLITAFSYNLIIAALAPAKVSEVETNHSAEAGAKPPTVIYVKTFTMGNAASKSENAVGEGRPRLLGALRGGEENTVVGRHREAQQEDTLAKVPAVLQNALIEDLSKSIASAANGDGTHPSPASWIITGEFLEVDTGNRALQAGVGLGAGQSHLEVRAKIYAVPNMKTPFLTFDSDGASGHMPGAAVMHKNPYAAAAKFVMSKKEPEREAKKVAQSIADEIGKFMAAQSIPTLKSSKASGAASPHGDS
jgi:Domain of unknown function (DUF4410)